VQEAMRRPGKETGGVRRKKVVPSGDALWGYIFIAPAFVFVIGFTFLPVLAALGISLTSWDLISPMKFIGLSNYRRILTDPLAQKTLINTFYYTFVSVPLGIVLSLFLALLLNQKLRALSLFRTAYYLPVVSSTVAVSVIFVWILDPSYGLLNRALALIAIKPIPWLTSPEWAMPAVILVTVWRSLGFNIIILLAALQDVPQSLLDAATIDGAGRWQRFLYVSVPLITPALFFITVTGFIGSFQSFDLVYNMTAGGPARATYLIGFYIWEQAFAFLRMGYGAALAFVLFILILLVTVTQWLARRRWVFGEQ
jgi:multiple sugar transport system permease protein